MARATRTLTSRRAPSLVPSLLVCAIAVSVHAGAGAQQAATSKTPEMSGSYERYRGAPGARGSQARDPYVPPPAPPPPLKPGYLKEWQAKQQAIREAEARGEPLGSNVTYCIPDGMPGMMGGPFPMEILQSKGQVTIIQEAYNQVRRILLDQPQKPIDDVEPGFYGRSVGHWEGDTLVVDTVGIKESVRYQNVPHSKDMRINERIRPVTPDIVWDEITIDDPAMLEKPWTYTLAYKRTPGYTLLEYVCEDNREYTDEKGIQRFRLASPDR